MTTKLLFDIDGVVVHPGTRWVRADEPWFSRLESERGFPFQDFSDRFFRAMSSELSLKDLCSIGVLDTRETIDEILVELDSPINTDELLRYWFEHDAYVDERLIGIIGVLRRAGLKCYLATSQEKLRQEFLWRDLGLSEHFDGIFSTAELGIKKESESFFQVVASQLGGDSHQVVYFDDKGVLVDIARRCGFDAALYVGWPSFTRHPKVQPILDADYHSDRGSWGDPE